MLSYLLILSLLVFCVLLYRFLPNKKAYAYFCVTLVLTSAFLYFTAQKTEPPPTVLTEEERTHIMEQQKIFHDWYAGYQKLIDRLDRNWTRYHHTVEAFKSGSIDVQTAHIRLLQLETDARLLHDELSVLAPPMALDDPCYDLTTSLIQKTQEYGAAQYRTIALSRAATDPLHLTSKLQSEQSHALQSILVKESPSGLFTAYEISSIRDILSLPEEIPQTAEPKNAAAP